MAVTGQTFDLDPKTFTLANMFAMQLHKYKEDIAKVTSCALKELTIENEIKKLAETWQEQRFDLHKYHSVSTILAKIKVDPSFTPIVTVGLRLAHCHMVT